MPFRLCKHYMLEQTTAFHSPSIISMIGNVPLASYGQVSNLDAPQDLGFDLAEMHDFSEPRDKCPISCGTKNQSVESFLKSL